MQERLADMVDIIHTLTLKVTGTPASACSLCSVLLLFQYVTGFLFHYMTYPRLFFTTQTPTEQNPLKSPKNCRPLPCNPSPRVPCAPSFFLIIYYSRLFMLPDYLFFLIIYLQAVSAKLFDLENDITSLQVCRL
jgi:hypothetical protein